MFVSRNRAAPYISGTVYMGFALTPGAPIVARSLVADQTENSWMLTAVDCES
jgi:hypothetical protein